MFIIIKNAIIGKSIYHKANQDNKYFYACYNDI
jgi:hypothetical protein